MGFISGLIIGGIAGAVIFYLVLRNNPKLAKKIAGVVDTIDNTLSEK